MTVTVTVNKFHKDHQTTKTPPKEVLSMVLFSLNYQMSASAVPPISAALAFMTTKYVSIAGSTLYLYDLILTWDDEVSIK